MMPTPGIQPSQWRVIILSSLGGALEFYDFVIYSMFAQYIGAAFFPASSSLDSLMYSFSVFAVGYLARPLGGIVFSHFGDKYGRRPVFIVSILSSALAVAVGSVAAYGLAQQPAELRRAREKFILSLRIAPALEEIHRAI